jgi:type II secretory pathway component PulJ
VKRQPRPRHPRGSFLIEILVWLSIMAAISVLTGEMMISGMRLEKQSFQRDTRISRVDSAIDALRRDAWHAAAIRAADGQVTFDGAIVWRMESGHILTRMNPADTPSQKSWIEMPDFSFSAAGPLLTVAVKSTTDVAENESVTLPSQRMLVGGAP